MDDKSLRHLLLKNTCFNELNQYALGLTGFYPTSITNADVKTRTWLLEFNSDISK